MTMQVNRDLSLLKPLQLERRVNKQTPVAPLCFRSYSWGCVAWGKRSSRPQSWTYHEGFPLLGKDLVVRVIRTAIVDMIHAWILRLLSWKWRTNHRFPFFDRLSAPSASDASGLLMMFLWQHTSRPTRIPVDCHAQAATTPQTAAVTPRLEVTDDKTFPSEKDPISVCHLRGCLYGKITVTWLFPLIQSRGSCEVDRRGWRVVAFILLLCHRYKEEIKLFAANA